MKLKELIGKYLTSHFDKQDAAVYFNTNKNSNIELPKEITNFISKFNKNEIISEQEFKLFSSQLSKLDTNSKDMIIHLIYQISLKIHKEHEGEIAKVVKDIEDNLKSGRSIPGNSVNANKYLGLLNCHKLFSQYLPIKEGNHNTNMYPGIRSVVKETICIDIPLAINALRLVGKLPKTAEPNYPLNLAVVKKDKVALKKGIKESEKYYPYKRISKIGKGDTGDNTFVATDGRKILFVRGVEDYSPNAILSSKIATLISPTHFSSERLLDNRLVGSRGISAYARSAADRRTRNDRNKYIQEDKRVFPGSGIIDEVTNFVQETDPNVENFGFSDENIFKSHLSKIDFDRCNPISELPKENYEQDMLTRRRDGIYHAASHVQNDPAYIEEKLFARLKLSMLSEPLLSKLADKAYTSEGDKNKDKAIQECTNRTNIAFELFLERPDAKAFLSQNPTMLNKCYHEIAEYISTHFEEEDQELLQQSLTERVAHIQQEITKKFNISLPPLTNYEKKQVQQINPAVNKQSDKDVEPSISLQAKPVENKQQGKVAEPQKPTKSESTFLSRNWLKLLGITALCLIGIGVGAALTATAVLAPLGVGVVGFAVASAVGFGAGLAVGGMTFGTKIAYDEYQYSASQSIPSLQAKVEPSSRVQNSMIALKSTEATLEKNFKTAEQLIQDVKKTGSKDKALEQESDLSDKLNL